MNTLTRHLWRALFDSETPPDLIVLGLPSREERRKLIEDVRGSIDDRERLLQHMEASTGVTNPIPDITWTGSIA
jgi:hypothetical protein